MPKNLISQFLTRNLCCYLIEKCAPQQEDETLAHIEECLRFLYLTCFTKGAIPVSQKVDDIWHLLILQTQEYFSLCESLPSKKYIHHTSDVYLKYADKEKVDNLVFEAKHQLEWLVSYVANFGNLTEGNVKYWSFANALCLKLNLSLDKLNDELHRLSLSLR